LDTVSEASADPFGFNLGLHLRDINEGYAFNQYEFSLNQAHDLGIASVPC